jgi:hypothetical protein
VSSVTTWKYPWLTLDNGNWKCEHVVHQDPVPPQPLLWCEHIKECIDEGDDAEMYHLGLKLSVPIFPSNEIWAMVVIDTEPVVARSAMMTMEYTPDFGSTKKIPLGLWNPGEGASSMRTCIVDYIKSKLAPGERLTNGAFMTRCSNNSHSLKSSRLMEENCDQPGWKWQCLWNMVMEGACTPCLGLANGTTSEPDDNFGIDDSVIDKPRWT